MLTKKILAVALTGMMALGAVAAGPNDPGPNGNNDSGLCTAYFNGQKEGHDNPNARPNGDQPGPFEGLEAAGEAASNGEEQGAEAAYYYCMVMEGAPGIGGNPDHGRYTCYVEQTNDPNDQDGQDVVCEDNDEPGNAGDNRGPKDNGGKKGGSLI